MKRDMDLCRDLLIGLELREQPSGWIDLEVAGHLASEIAYHIRLLAEGGLIEAANLTTLDGSDWKPMRLTWEGHEFLGAIKNDGTWKKTKSFVIEKTGSLTLELLKVGASEVTKRLLTGQIHLP